jgi:hypothetical protein
MTRLRTIAPLLLLAGCASGGGDAENAGQVVSQLASGSGDATLALTSNWGSGYCAEVSIANRGSSGISDWSLTLDLKQASVGNLWNGTRADAVVTPVAHNQTIGAGAKVSFGFCANVSNAAQIPPAIAALSVTSSGNTDPDTDPPDTNPPDTNPPDTDPPDTNPPDTNPPDTNPPDTDPPDTNPSNYPPIQTGCRGYATRFWDCCKPHCGWQANVPSGVSPLNSCTQSNAPISDVNAQSSCSGGGAYMCQGLAPYAVSSNLAYGYAATSNGDICGRCYQLDFDGSSHNAGDDPGSQALAGKTMIVQAMNVGYDVGGGQFDLLVPGGGVGAFNACSAQWGVSSSELGAQYGGFLSKCKQQHGYGASLDTYKSCVAHQCTSVFGSRGLKDLEAGCHWFVDWFQAADNPALKYKEVACPAALTSESGMNRSARNDVSAACGN